MTDPVQTQLSDLKASGEAIGRLAADPELFGDAVAAFRADDAERFQDALGRVGLLDRCQWICRWFCSKHCIYVCLRLAGPAEPAGEVGTDEWREFAEFTGRLAQDVEQLKTLLGIVATEDAEAWRAYVAKNKIERFSHQLCHWLCRVRCRVACRRLCPPLPELIKVSNISVGHIDAQGYAAGPSSPPAFTPPDDPANGLGDHPFGGSSHLNGLFGVAGAAEYKVEYATSTAGPWTAITTPVTDAHVFGGLWSEYPRVPTGDWYSIADMDLLSEGHSYLTDWNTPAGAVSDLYYLRLVVRNAGLTEFPSIPVPVRVDNKFPSGPVPPDARPLIEFTQAGAPLGCCAEVAQDDGPINVHIEGTDENFSSLSVTAYGGCSGSFTIYSKTYQGDRSDTGAPAPGIDILWDPWSSGVEPCCYVVFVRLYDRTIIDNAWRGDHVYENWRSITVG